MEKLLYPMKNVAISQLEFSSKGSSHQYIPAIDLRGEDTGKDYGRACCTCKILGTNSYANTIYFGSCDINGKEAKVLCADGKERVITFALTHCDDISKYKVDDIFSQKEVCYLEGKKGMATGNHIHLEICEGWEYPKKYYWRGLNKVYCFNPKTALKPTDVLWLERDFHVIISGWKEFNQKWYTRKDDEMIYIRMDKGGTNIREELTFSKKKTNAKKLITIPKGQTAEIMEFIPGIQPDGYQWAKVKYNGIVGYSQLDTAYNTLFK